MSTPHASSLVHLVIDELVLEGIEPAHGEAVRASMERELVRQLAAMRATGTPWAGTRSLGDIDAGTVHVATAARPERIGTQAARALIRGVTTGVSRP